MLAVRRIVGITIPVVVPIGIVGWHETGASITGSGNGLIFGLLALGAMAGYLLRRWWAAIYVLLVLGLLWLLAIITSFAGFKMNMADDVIPLFGLAAIGAAVGQQPEEIMANR